MGAVLIGLHSATFALLGVLAILAFLHQRRSVTGRLLIALCLSLMALMISTLPLGVGLPPEILWTARIMDVPNTVLAWLFITSMMQDGFKIEAKHVAISLAYCVGAWSLWLNHFVEWTPYIRQVSWAVNLGVLALFLNLLLQVWQQRRSDLVETRRTLRLVFIVSVVSTVAVSILSEIFLRPNAPELVDLNKMLITLLLVAVGLVWFTRIPADHIAFAATLPQPGTATDQGRLTAKTKAQLDHLHRA
nr:hypothetical protein [Erythrobacter sp.]